MARIQISKDPSGHIIVSFPYDPLLVTKVKTIDGRRWQPVEKNWSFPNREEILEEIRKVFADNEVQIDPALQANPPKGTVPDFVVSAQSNDLQTTYPYPPHRWGREREGVKKLESGLSPKFAFEDLRRELVSRKYSYKTIKGYLYYNKDFINYIGKNTSEIKDDDINPAPFSRALDRGERIFLKTYHPHSKFRGIRERCWIKDYLVYLSEEKGSATSTLNQAINAMKFYYGTVLKKKFVYEVKRPRKDKKLPTVLSKEEVTKILSSVDNVKHKAILMLVYPALF